MNDSPEYLEGKEFIFKYGRWSLLPLDRLRKDEFGNTIASEQNAYRRERIVRCRDCRRSFEECGDLWCRGIVGPPVEPDGFCAWGEEREG